MEITIEAIKALREQTGVGVMECKRALTEAEGDFNRAVEILRQRGLAAAAARSNRVASQGTVEAYIHAGGRIGALVEVNCETDFVARTETFRELVHDIAMQVAAMAPLFVSAEELPEEAGLDPREVCLLLQPFIKDPSKTIGDLVRETIAQTGENIKVRRFARFELGN